MGESGINNSLFLQALSIFQFSTSSLLPKIQGLTESWHSGDPMVQAQLLSCLHRLLRFSFLGQWSPFGFQLPNFIANFPFLILLLKKKSCRTVIRVGLERVRDTCINMTCLTGGIDLCYILEACVQGSHTVGWRQHREEISFSDLQPNLFSKPSHGSPGGITLDIFFSWPHSCRRALEPQKLMRSRLFISPKSSPGEQLAVPAEWLNVI